MEDLIKNEFEVKWHIENVKGWFETRNDVIYSPQFSADTCADTQWKLSLSPNWLLAEKYVSFAVQRDVEDDHPDLIKLNYELSFLSSDGTTLKCKTGTRKFAPKTVSHKLNVKLDEILDEKNNNYLSGEVLTVCCKFWKWSTVSKAVQCSMRSVIGNDCIVVKSYVDDFNPSSTVSVNFMVPLPGFNRISLDVFVSDNEFIFERKNVELNSFNWYSFNLYALNGKGYGMKFDERSNLTKELNLPSHNTKKLASIDYSDFKFRYLPNGRLTLQLEVTYYPGIRSECIESKCSSNDKLSCKLSNLVVNLKNRNSDNLHQADFSNDEDESSSNDEDESSTSHEDGSWCSDEDESWFNDGDVEGLPSTTFKEDFTSLFKDSFFSDIKIQAGMDIFPAHKCVLSARSPVFKAMLMNDKREKASACINISDISSETTQQMLQFLYTDSISNLEMLSAKQLYIAADKYDIASLKQRCSVLLKKHLTPSNVSAILVLADTYQDKDLKLAAQKFVLKHDKEVFVSEEWKLFMTKFSGLAAQVMYLKCIKE